MQTAPRRNAGVRLSTDATAPDGTDPDPPAEVVRRVINAIRDGRRDGRRAMLDTIRSAAERDPRTAIALLDRLDRLG